MEEKYIMTTTSCTQVLWMKKTLQDIQVKFDEPISIFFDNTSAISISKILWCIPKQSTFWSNIIFLESRFLKRISSLNMVAQRNKLLTYLLNHYLMNHSSIFAKSVGFSYVLIRLLHLSNQVERGSGGVYRSTRWHFVRGLPSTIDKKGERR